MSKSPHKTPQRWILLAFTVFLSPVQAQTEETAVVAVGQLSDVALNETSGLAASRRWPGVYWALNDSFGPTALFALKASGEVLARVEITGAANLDWEDLAAFESEGQSYLAIGDIGNNLALDENLRIYIVPEPALKDRSVAVLRDHVFRFRDGPRDAEGLAVDVPGQRFLITDKGRQPAGLYALPMAGDTRFAERIADIPFVWPERKTLAQPLRASWRATPTALDLSPDGLRLLLLTYRHIMAFTRKPDEDWATALQRRPQWARLEKNLGYEAAAWSTDGRHALIAHEGERAAVYRWTLP